MGKNPECNIKKEINNEQGIEKNYNPSEIEDRLYHKWLEKKYFHAEVNRDKKPFTIVMPPPNITGKLHMGHALDNTMQDIIIRFKRMQGYEALWIMELTMLQSQLRLRLLMLLRKKELTSMSLEERAS